MTRSSRHKSSKHREAREYSDSEKELSSKDRKESGGGGGGRVSKESSEKRKVEVKEKSEYAEELVTSSSKRRKEKERMIVVDIDGGSDRWNGGEYDRRDETTTTKSRKRDGSVEMYGEEVKKSSGKSEGKHREKERDSSRGGVEREKKTKDGKSEVAKQDNENIDLNGWKDLESPEPEIQIDRRLRKRRGDSGDTDKHLNFVEDINGVRLSSKDDLGRVDRQKEDRFGEKFREDMDRDNKPRDEKQRDEKHRSERSTKDSLSSKSEDKHLRDEKDLSDTPQKRSKLQDGELKGEHDRDRNRDHDSYHARDRERYHDREHGWDHGRDRDRDYDRDWDWDREKDGDRGRERNRDRERGRDRDRDGERDREYDRDYDGSHLDDRSTRYKDSSRGKRRSPDDRDDSTDAKPRGVKPRYSDFEKKPSSGDRVESDVNKGRSQSRQTYADSSKRRTSPSSNSNAGIDEYRYGNPEETKYRESIADQRSKALPPRDVSGGSERGSKFRSMDKSSKMDDNHLGELSNEKPSGSKASPMSLMERSPSSSSIDRRFMNKNAARRSIDIEETGRRSSGFDNRDRDFSNAEDRPSRDLALEKPFMDDSSPADSLTHNKSGQSNFSSFPPHPNFRAGAESPSFSGSVEEDGRINSSARYRRSDPNLVRGPWRGVPNWPSPVPNGFMPFPHGGPHGGFQGMLPQFSAPPIFGVRPSMEINHFGIPYQIADDRFPGHMRPLGSQNMMEGLGPSHMHPWDGNTGAFRDDSNNYGAEWDQNRHPMSVRGWDPTAEPWKAQNNDAKRDMPSPSPRNDYPLQSMVDDGVAGQVGQMSHHEDNQDLGVHTKKDEVGSAIVSPIKESPVVHEKSRGGSNLAIDEVPSFRHYYLSKLDISAELAHTELYNQCMSILDTEGSSAADEELTIHTILKAAKAGSRSSKSLFSTSLFPPVKDSVFQKAMDLYKRERMEAKVMPYVAGGRSDIILASNQKTTEATICVVEKVDQLVLKTEAEVEDVLVSSSNEKNALFIISSGSVEERPNELVSTPVQEIQNHTSHGSPKLEMEVEDSGLVEPEEPQTVPNGLEMDSLSSGQVTLEVVDTTDGVSLLESEFSLPTTTTLPAVGNNVRKAEEGKSLHPAEEGVAVDAIKDPSVIPDGFPKACDALMSGSNESDSVILSRIHHSPESTH